MKLYDPQESSHFSASLVAHYWPFCWQSSCWCPLVNSKLAQAPRKSLNIFMAIWSMDGTTERAESPLGLQASNVSRLLWEVMQWIFDPQRERATREGAVFWPYNLGCWTSGNKTCARGILVCNSHSSGRWVVMDTFRFEDCFLTSDFSISGRRVELKWFELRLSTGLARNFVYTHGSSPAAPESLPFSVNVTLSTLWTLGQVVPDSMVHHKWHI